MASSPGTLIFVDVDGVLNVGIKDENPEMPALDFSMQNLSTCYSIRRSGKIAAEDAATVDKILSVAAHSLEPLSEDYATYQELLIDSCNSLQGLDLIHIFVQRLAKLIQAAGSQRLVVLSSTWRRPQHSKKTQKLEKAIASVLGEPFAFDARTSLEENRDVAGRLKGIRAFIQDHVAASETPAGPLRVLVLDDFHNRPLKGWKCDGNTISSTQDAEAYLKCGIPAHPSNAVRLIHTYAEWRTESGRLVQVGAGMTMNHFRDGLEFLTTAAKQLVPAQGVGSIAAPKKDITKTRLRSPPRLGLENIGEVEFDSCSSGIEIDPDACDSEQCSPSKTPAEEFSSHYSMKRDTEVISIDTICAALDPKRPTGFATGYSSRRSLV